MLANVKSLIMVALVFDWFRIAFLGGVPIFAGHAISRRSCLFHFCNHHCTVNPAIMTGGIISGGGLLEEASHTNPRISG
jgi:hypothetical protein